ncbi:site-specific DNA-methyltransferase [Vibrio alfacsensis]|uniref:site-specific DNA-methyltransferase n=1 Tax=Vibrio alfacsensis TaxID=1074311 RepID=UPI0040687A19
MPTLDWLKKDKAVIEAKNCQYRSLNLVPELSYGNPDSENMFIQGDNLEALKALVTTKSNSIQCIYIDPPFNTAQAFDNYDDNLQHSTWLSTMYPRFELLHQLLREDGTFFLHLDDNEIAYAIVICDEIFGRKNRIFLSTFKQSSASGPKARNPGVVSTASFVVCYAKNKSKWKSNKLFVARERNDRYNKFIINRDAPTEQWEFCTLREAFAAHSKVEVKDLKKKYLDKYEEKLTNFVLANASAVYRTATVADKDVGDDAKIALANSRVTRGRVFEAKREGQTSQFFMNGEQVAFYSSISGEIDGVLTTKEPLSSIWDDLLSNNLHKEGSVKFKNGKKPEALVKRVIELSTNEGDFVLDSFSGSGTTAATALKMNRKFIGIEMGEQAKTHCFERLKLVVNGDDTGVSKVVNWSGGGGFNYFRLGERIFKDDGSINENVSFADLAAHIWYTETNTPYLKKDNSPLLGVHKGTAYYLQTGQRNNLTTKSLQKLPNFDGPKVIFSESIRMTTSRINSEQIIFKQIPYDIRGR